MNITAATCVRPYNSSRGSLNAGYSYDRDSQRVDYGASGSIIAHADGITLGQDITDAAVLVKAPGLDDVKLTTDNTISTDYRGYAIVPYVTPISPHRYYPLIAPRSVMIWNCRKPRKA